MISCQSKSRRNWIVLKTGLVHGFERMACVAIRKAGKNRCLDLYDWHARRAWLLVQTDKQGFALLEVHVQGGGFSPKVPSQLDVHHLRPLADGGERLTGLQDLAVLCANCHRLAHAAHPPLAVEAIRALHAIE